MGGAREPGRTVTSAKGHNAPRKTCPEAQAALEQANAAHAEAGARVDRECGPPPTSRRACHAARANLRRKTRALIHAHARVARLCEPPQAPPSWTKVEPAASPIGRDSHGTAFDSSRGVLVLFGGSTAATSYTNETWEWDGAGWTQTFPATVPPAHTYVRMAYDSLRHVVVMFGGWLSDAGPRFGETWEYDGVDWTCSLVVKLEDSLTRRGSGMERTGRCTSSAPLLQHGRSPGSRMTRPGRGSSCSEVGRLPSPCWTTFGSMTAPNGFRFPRPRLRPRGTSRLLRTTGGVSAPSSLAAGLQRPSSTILGSGRGCQKTCVS